MIIRRKHTANFTTIGNALFGDDRLALDEIGLMCFLLSKPHDWEVRRMALRRQFKIGRDGMRRIMRNLIQCGWVVAEVTRLEGGRVFIIYQVRDEPGPELTAEEAKAALSLVSSGAGPDTSEGESEADEESGEPDADPGGSVTDGRPAGGGEPPPVSHPPPYKSLQNTDSQKPESTKRVRDFADVKAGWPPENILSEAASQTAFLSLTDAQKEAAFQGERPYLDDCRSQGRKVCDLRTYLTERRWERFQASSGKPAMVVVKVGTPQFYRWKDFLEIRREWTSSKQHMVDKHGGFAVPSEWPPAETVAKTG